MGMDPAAMEEHYDIVTVRIGISGPQNRSGIQPALTPRFACAADLEKAASKGDYFTKRADERSSPFRYFDAATGNTAGINGK